MGKGAIFLDRDGVINENLTHHVKSWDEFTFLPGVFDAMELLATLNMPVFVVTNQAAVARGQMTQQALDDIHTRMLEAITSQGGHVDKVYYCPHDCTDACDCRKPRPGMLQQAAREYGIDLSASFFVGDAWTDMDAGIAVGVHNILVMTGRGQQQCTMAHPLKVYERFHVAQDLPEAVSFIMRSVQRAPQPVSAVWPLARRVSFLTARYR